MAKTVSFTRMIDGSGEDYALLAKHDRAHGAGTGDRVLAHLGTLATWPSGYAVDRLEHSLQTATRAHRDGADEELVVCALLHDIGDMLAPDNHGPFAADVLRPFVSAENAWLVEKHGVFQGYFFWHHYGMDRNAREKYRGHPAFEKTANFCERWDQTSFDPAYDSMPLEAFEPMVQRIFGREPWKHVQPT